MANITMHFQECSNIFSKGGGEELAKLTESIFLGKNTHFNSVATRCRLTLLPNGPLSEVLTSVREALARQQPLQ